MSSANSSDEKEGYNNTCNSTSAVKQVQILHATTSSAVDTLIHYFGQSMISTTEDVQPLSFINCEQLEQMRVASHKLSRGCCLIPPLNSVTLDRNTFIFALHQTSVRRTKPCQFFEQTLHIFLDHIVIKQCKIQLKCFLRVQFMLIL